MGMFKRFNTKEVKYLSAQEAREIYHEESLKSKTIFKILESIRDAASKRFLTFHYVSLERLDGFVTNKLKDLGYVISGPDTTVIEKEVHYDYTISW